MTIKFALALQLKMNRITPTNIFGAKNPDKFPLSPEELNWKLALYRNLARNKKNNNYIDMGRSNSWRHSG